MDRTSESSVALGERLKRVRELKGLSQREMGRRAGITNSNISMIEQGLISPSITSLERLLAVIPMSLEQFFTWNPSVAEGQVFRAESLKSVEELGAGLHVQKLHAQSLSLADDNALSLVHCVLEPGSDTGARSRKEPYSLLAWLLKGEVELTMGVRVFSLVENDGFYLPAQQIYRLRNFTQLEAVLIWARDPK